MLRLDSLPFPFFISTQCSIMMLSKAVLLASITSILADEYTWNGRNAGFDNADNWSGGGDCNPAKDNKEGCTGYSGVVFGAPGSSVVSTITAQSTNMGKKITFYGKSKLILGDGDSKAKLVFNSVIVPGATDATFLPGQRTSDATSAYDLRCPTNWLDEDGNVATRAPCGSSDKAIFPFSPIYANSNGRNFVVGSIRVNGRDTPQTSSSNGCPSVWSAAGVSIDIGTDCSKWTDDSSICEKNGYSGRDSECAKSTRILKWPIKCKKPQVGTWVEGPSGISGKIFDSNNEIVDWGIPERDGNTIKFKDVDGKIVYNAVFSKDGTKITSLTGASGKDICELPSGGFDPEVASSMDEVEDGDNIGVIIGGAAGAVVVIVIAVVMYTKRRVDSDEPNRSVVSFENPLYDDAGKPVPQASAGAYSDVHASPGGGSSGYMDVPVGGGYAINDADTFGGFDDEPGYAEPTSSAGYMDVNAEGGGYMDVTAGDEEEEDV